MTYFPEPYIHSRNKIKVELDLFNYATKSDLKITTGGDTSKFTQMVNLVSLKLDIDRLHINILETTPLYFAKKTINGKLV